LAERNIDQRRNIYNKAMVEFHKGLSNNANHPVVGMAADKVAVDIVVAVVDKDVADIVVDPVDIVDTAVDKAAVRLDDNNLD
jgi:hypothetical protein